MRRRLVSSAIFLLSAILPVFIFSCAPATPHPAQVNQAAIDQPAPKPAKIALVLGAGASRGFAHIGVIKVLEENHVPIDMVFGASAGSLVGSLFAYGYSPYDLQKMAISIKKGDLTDLAIPDGGFIKGQKLQDFVDHAVRNTPMEKLKIPFYAVATDIDSGKEVIFGKGDTGMAVRASCSIPGVFQPVSIGGQMYVDGGVTSPLPVEEARRYGASLVIAVDISSDLDTGQPDGITGILFKTVGIMYAELEKAGASQADVVIRPKVGNIGSGDFSKRNLAIMEGEKAAWQAMPEIRRKLNALREAGRLPAYSSLAR